MRKDVANLMIELSNVIDPVIKMLPKAQSDPILSRKKSADYAPESVEDIAAQTVYLHKIVESAVNQGNYCGDKLKCEG